jgi:thiosulfate/3-mercaptopyruvate sulfurtransferase
LKNYRESKLENKGVQIPPARVAGYKYPCTGAVQEATSGQKGAGMIKSVLALILLFSSSLFALPKLLSPAELSKRIGDKNIVILEFSDTQSYMMEGHIPGAVLTEKEEWRVMEEKSGALVHRDISYYEKKFRDWGISEDTEVVIYYKGNQMNEILGAVYAYWIFHLLGHKKVSILEGGWKAWLERELPIDYEEPKPIKGNFKARYEARLKIDWRYLKSSIGKRPIIDGRPVGHYFGITKFPAAKKYGHVPCSVPLPWEWWVKRDEDSGKLYIEFPTYVGEFLKNHGIGKKDEVLLFCFGGTGAAFLYMVMDVLGFEGMKVYDASKREWEHLNLPLNRYLWETFRDCRYP